MARERVQMVKSVELLEIRGLVLIRHCYNLQQNVALVAVRLALEATVRRIADAGAEKQQHRLGVADAQQELDKKIHEAIGPSVEEVKELGYPGLHDPQEIRFRTRIQTAELLDHGTAVQYSMQKDSLEELLPEYSIGLGYQNLQSLSYQLVSFKAARLNPE